MLIYRNMEQKCLFKVDPWEFPTVQALKEFIALELSLSKYTDIRVYGKTGQEVIDDEDLVNANILFFTAEGTPILNLDETFNYQNCLTPYEIVKQLGEGGFGKVVLAKDRFSHEQVAIKFIPCNNNRNRLL